MSNYTLNTVCLCYRQHIAILPTAPNTFIRLLRILFSLYKTLFFTFQAFFKSPLYIEWFHGLLLVWNYGCNSHDTNFETAWCFFVTVVAVIKQNEKNIFTAWNKTVQTCAPKSSIRLSVFSKAALVFRLRDQLTLCPFNKQCILCFLNVQICFISMFHLTFI